MVTQIWVNSGSGNGLLCDRRNALSEPMQWNLYKATTKFCGLSRQVVFYDRENKHDFVKTVPCKCSNLCVFSKTSPVLLYRFRCIDLSSVKSYGIHLRTLSQEDFKIPISETKLIIAFLLKLHPYLLGTNELINTTPIFLISVMTAWVTSIPSLLRSSSGKDSCVPGAPGSGRHL